MKVEVELTSPDKFHKALSRQIPSQIVGNQLVLNQEFGEGGMKYLQLQKGLYVDQIDVKLNAPLSIHRTPKSKNDHFVLHFYLSKSNIVQEINGAKYKLGFDNMNVILSSSCTEAIFSIPSGIPIKLFNIGFTIDWLEEHLLTHYSFDFFSIFRTNRPIYLVESIDYLYKKKLNLTDFRDQSKLSITSGTLQLLDYFFKKVSERKQTGNGYHNINLTEFAIMQKIRENIDNSIESKLSVENLAKIAGMSLSKFKILFKQIFGTTPYKYYLANRMERSMELLATKKYSVSEVGYIIGYSNPSQFTKSFQKHFGVLPSEVK